MYQSDAWHKNTQNHRLKYRETFLCLFEDKPIHKRFSNITHVRMELTSVK